MRLVAVLTAALLSATGLAGAQPAGAELTGSGRTATVFVELATSSAVDAFEREDDRGRAIGAARESRRLIGEITDKVLKALRDKDSRARQVARTANAVPGFVVTGDAARLRELSALSEVRSVRAIVPKTASNSGAAQLTRAVKVWQDNGKLGEGLRIGVIDTGVDYTHADFGGEGTVEAYRAVDRTAPWTPNAKVVGGHDFVGDDYDADDPDHATPVPDPNPMDCFGHGTHVAGTAAGYGVETDGSTFRGDHRMLTPEHLDRMRVGPGTAPAAEIYALKVFGCTGSTNLTAEAMDWSLDPNGDGDFSDHLDVVNLSLGTDFGGQDDPDSLFVRKLVRNGVLVVAAAGNGGDFYDAGGAPGNTPEALTVANTRDAHVLLDGLGVTDLGDQPGQYSQDYRDFPALDLTRPVVRIQEESNVDGCGPVSQDLTGKVVWLEWDEDDATRECGSKARTDNAEKAGADGVLLTSTRAIFAAAIAGNATTPVFQFTGPATQRVRPLLDAGTLEVRFQGTGRRALPTLAPSIADTITPTSARGARGPVGAKPDVAAPGDTIVSAAVGTGADGVSKGGTSMSTPHVAGIAALVRETHPDWTVEEVKAAVVNTADATVVSGDDRATGVPEAPMRVGAGRVDARQAVDTDLLAMVADDPGSVGVTFGTVPVNRSALLMKTVRVVNKSTTRRTASVAYRPSTEVPGARIEVRPSEVSVPPGGEARVRVTLRVTASELRKVADPTLRTTEDGRARQFLSEASGLVVVSSGEAAARVPVYAAPKPVSALTAAMADGTVRVNGRGFDRGGYASMVSAFELQGRSPELPPCDDEPQVACAVNGSARGGDLRYVGVTSTPGAEDPVVAFGIAMWGQWYTLGSVASPGVRIDTTGDGEPDFAVTAVKPTDPGGSVKADVWLARTTRLADRATVDERPLNGAFGDVDTNLMDSDVVVLPVGVRALGVDPAAGSARISYTARVTGAYAPPGTTDNVIDTLDVPMSFDVLRPGFAVLSYGSAVLSTVVADGAEFEVRRDDGALAADGSDSLLVLFHHNGAGRRAEVLTP
ncbi:S8 family serine peptidase [Saccharothrix violaceirubra]|uniref:Subtilisin family serine protease n=1 Tax=Saccharothrix violaceirubra TaxID=413306 RepID=A0A7W7T937_9PSEU|nr:S8 family serine peptidase [Saccharothrix violaceirubra]MBB4968819.1 subtilisin family serine protease [Saccharothrix violaceirubra]